MAVVYRHDDALPDDGLRYIRLADDPTYLLSLGVTTMPGLALQSYRSPGIHASELPDRRRISIATYGEPPDPPATAAFVAALRTAAAAATRDVVSLG